MGEQAHPSTVVCFPFLVGAYAAPCMVKHAVLVVGDLLFDRGQNGDRGFTNQRGCPKIEPLQGKTRYVWIGLETPRRTLRKWGEGCGGCINVILLVVAL